MAKNLFNSIKLTKPKTNSFDLSHDVKLSLNMGDLVPIMITECVPGDHFNISCESLLRFAPLISPVMHRMDVSMHYFFVPNRISWNKWEDFITNTPDPISGQLPAVPYLNVDEGSYGKLHDYLGLPTPGLFAGRVSALPFAAYQRVWMEYYRDQNLITKPDIDLVNGDNGSNLELLPLRKRAWEHDYFTSALPFAQKGPAVDLPLGEVTVNPDWDGSGGGPYPHFFSPVGPTVGNEPVYQDSDAVPGNPQINLTPGVGGFPLAFDPEGSLEVGATTINDLRRAFKLQEWLEKAARGGSRYFENILSFFGVRSPDARLQRPEYITGTKSPVVISEVLNTTGTEDLPQGNMAGQGTSVTSGKHGSFFCQEHGYIIGIMSVLPKTAYQDGIPKHFLKTSDPFQFYWPQFANIGEQEVELQEVYAYTQAYNNSSIFGYVPRYAEYKFEQNRVAGDFRTNLDFWHLGRKFTAAPALNQAFIEANPTTRVFAVEDAETDKLYAHVYNKVRATRPMPKFGTPTF